MGTRLFPLIAVILMTGCAQQCAGVTTPVVGDACDAAQQRLSELGCEEAQTPKGTSFARACVDARQDGRDWRPDCIAQIGDCSQVEDAYSTPKGTACKTQ
jgi:hypothetical protein